jgi:hypothetical protein
VNTGTIRAIDLNATRTGFAGSPHMLLTAAEGVHSMEVSPNSRIFFSGASGIYRLIAT